jgi:xylulokinase
MNLLGIDIGTTGVKAAVFGEDGRQLGVAYREYMEAGSCFELDPDAVFAYLCEAVREVANWGADAAALSVSGDEVVPVGKDGTCLYKMIMSMDGRGAHGMAHYLKAYTPAQIYELTGLPPHAKYGANRILWFGRNRPELFEKTWRFMTWEDFVWLRLGVEEPAVSASTAARLMLYNIHTMSYDKGLLAQAGITSGMLSGAVMPGTAIGRISPKAASALGFKRPLLAVAGGFDQACAALGAGAVRPGEAAVSTGTMESLSVCAGKPPHPDMLLNNHYPCNMHAVPGRYLIGATNVGGGLLVKWMRDKFYAGCSVGGSMSYGDMFSGLTDKPSGLVLLPHFAGSGPPFKDKDSLGAVLGLTPQTDRDTLLKAVLEGITFELKQNLEMLHDCGIDVTSLNAVGGGSQSGFWLQLKADITGIPVQKPEVSEAGCFAAAVLAGVGSGVYTGAGDAKNLMKIEKTFEPRNSGKAYEPYYGLYKKLYPQIKDILHGLKGLN